MPMKHDHQSPTAPRRRVILAAVGVALLLLVPFCLSYGMGEAATAREEAHHPDVVRYGLHHDEDGEIRFYVDDKPFWAGLVQDEEGNYYYINETLTAVKDTDYYIWNTHDLLPRGTYTFGPDGKLIMESE